MPIRFIFILIRLAYTESRNRNITGLKNRSGTRKKNGHHITAVTRNGEKFAKNDVFLSQEIVS